MGAWRVTRDISVGRHHFPCANAALGLGQFPFPRVAEDNGERETSVRGWDAGLSRLWLGNLVVVCSRDPPDVCLCGSLDSAGCMGAGEVALALMTAGEI